MLPLGWGTDSLTTRHLHLRQTLSVQRLILALENIVLVEQNFHFAATVADRHYVVEQGRVIDMIPNHLLESSMDKLHEYLGV